MGRKTGGYYPPVLRHYQEVSPTTDQSQTPDITTKFDIYQLGLILWLLAENNPQTRESTMCIRERYDTNQRLNDAKPHADPITLPPLPSHIPRYFQDIVAACHTARPERRPTARELLEKFPPMKCTPSVSLEPSLSSSSNFTSVGAGLLAGISCSRCGLAYIKKHYFHCNVCEGGDFDLCLQCYASGKHCDDRDHFLVELRKAHNKCARATHYHSSPQSDNTREVIDF